MQLIGAGLEVTAFGLGGVFVVLILFYCATKMMLIVTKKSIKRNREDKNF